MLYSCFVLNTRKKEMRANIRARMKVTSRGHHHIEYDKVLSSCGHLIFHCSIKGFILRSYIDVIVVANIVTRRTSKASYRSIWSCRQSSEPSSLYSARCAECLSLFVLVRYQYIVLTMTASMLSLIFTHCKKPVLNLECKPLTGHRWY